MLIVDNHIGMMIDEVLGKAEETIDPVATSADEGDYALCLFPLLFSRFHYFASSKFSTLML